MKKIVLPLLAALLMLNACQSKSNTQDAITQKAVADATSDSDYGTANFVVDGKSFTGKISKQTFTNNSYSVLCQQDEPFQLIQITFKDEATAKKGGSFTPADGMKMHVEANEAEVSVDATMNSKGKGSVEVNGNTLTLKDIECANMSGGKATINSAEIKLP